MLGEFFDPQADIDLSAGIRPHWSQAGAIVFATFRTYDSLPKEVLLRWEREKNEWMRRRGHATGHWSDVLPLLSQNERDEFAGHFRRCREIELDKCHGRCLLRRPGLGKIVADSLLHFDGRRYRMGDFVVILNHSYCPH